MSVITTVSFLAGTTVSSKSVVAKVSVDDTPEARLLASKNFLNLNPQGIASQLRDSLEGNMREIVGTLSLKDISTNRDSFSEQVKAAAAQD